MDAMSMLRKIQRSKVTTSTLRFFSKRTGENFYERDWDILIILDAARYDIVSEISDDYDYIDTVDKIRSRGSHSSEWCYNTFVTDHEKYDEDIRNTHYITGNVIASLVLNGASDTDFLDDGSYVEEAASQEYEHKRIERLSSYQPAWKDSLDMECEHIPPQSITARLLDILPNRRENDKYMLHYMQPHEPFVEADSERRNRWPNSKEDISMFNMSDNDYNQLMQNYKDNHRYIFDHLRIIMNQIDNDLDVAISADHGNITNKVLGVPYTFGHPNYVFFSKQLRNVPWIEVDQSKSRDPIREWDEIEVDKASNHTDEEVIDRLESLGYK